MTRLRLPRPKARGGSCRRTCDILDTLRGERWWSAAELDVELGWARQSVANYLRWLGETWGPLEVRAEGDWAKARRLYRWQ